MNLLILVPIFPNPVQTYVLNQLIYLKKSGINFTILANTKSNSRSYPQEILGFNLLENTLHLNPYSYREFLKYLFSYILTLDDLKRFIQIFGNDRRRYGIKYFLKETIKAKLVPRDTTIIHSHSVICTYEYLFLKETLNIPIITTFHGLVPRNVKFLDNDKLKKSFSNM